MDTMTDRSALEQKLIPELQRIAQAMGVEGAQKLRKAGLIERSWRRRRTEDTRTTGRRGAPELARRRPAAERRRQRQTDGSGAADADVGDAAATGDAERRDRGER